MGIKIQQAPARDERAAASVVRTVDVHTALGVERVVVVEDTAIPAPSAVELGAAAAAAGEALAGLVATAEAAVAESSAELLGMTVPEVRAAIELIADLEALDILEAAETAGKGRAGVLVAITRQREAIKARA